MTDKKVAIRVHCLGKRYTIGGPQEQYLTFRDAIVNSVKAPFKRFNRAPPDEGFWALKDVSFDVEQGEVIGIIGRNGAGKSTVLKILSRITPPTEGTVELHGRVGSLLEVGTGFHPEMTGRENIFLNGSILGMKRQEIDIKLDEIVKFSEIEKFLDTPVKRYSSGMYVRLAFAVAAHMDPEILLVDEVLAVGDAAFQKKCLGMMGEVAKAGRTVLFVSHNMGIIGQLCSRAILLDKGSIVMNGPVDEVITRYLENIPLSCDTPPILRIEPDTSKEVQILTIGLYNSEGIPTSDLDRSNPFTIQMTYRLNKPIEGSTIQMVIETENPFHIYLLNSYDTDLNPERIHLRERGTYSAKIEWPAMVLNAGHYQIRAWIWRPLGGDIYDEIGKLKFTLHDSGTFAAYGIGLEGKQRPGILGFPLKWEIVKNEMH